MFSITNYQKPKTPTTIQVPFNYLTGVNVGGLGQSAAQVPLVVGTNGKQLVAADVNYLVSKGVNCVRYCIAQKVLQSNAASNANVPFTDFHAANWAMFKTSVELCTNAGIYVIIAEHGGLDAEFGTFNSVKFNSDGGSQTGSILADFWRRMVEGFGATNNMIGYSLCNEPLLSSSGNQSWWKIAQDCIDTIRRAGSGQAIFVPGISYSGAQSWNSTPWNDPGGSGYKNADMFLTLKDPCDNLYAEVHAYMSANGTGSDNDVVSGTIGRERLQNVTQWANTTYTVNGSRPKFFVGEFGNKANVTYGTENITDYNNYLRSIAPINGGRCIGAAFWIFASYPWFNGDPFTLVPQGAAPPGGVDSLQMDMLEAINYFTPATVTPTFNPLTDLPNRYAYYNPATAATSGGLLVSLADSSGLAADATKTLVPKSASGWATAPEYEASSALFNNLPIIKNSDNASAKAMITGTFATPVSANATYYLVTYVHSLAPASTIYPRSNVALDGTFASGSHSLIHYSNMIASQNGTNNLSLSIGTTGLKIVAVVHSGGSSRIYINSLTAGATANTGSSTALNMGMGNRQWNPGLWSIGEHFIYSSAHSNTDVGTMMSYLAARYAITLT